MRAATIVAAPIKSQHFLNMLRMGAGAARLAVSVLKRRQIVGHVPRNISRACSVFLRNHGTIKCTVTGNRRHSSDLPQGGMEIPCSLCFTGCGDSLKKLSALFNSRNYDHPDEPNSSVKFEVVECEAGSKKGEVEGKVNDLVTGDSDSTTEDIDVWVKCDRQILRIADKEIIETGMELTDKHIQYAQYLIKKQFSTIGGLCSTLLQGRKKHSLPQNSLQVIYCSARHHWVVASNMECKKGVVNVYDSLFTTLDEETLDTINNWFGEPNAKRKIQYKMVQVQTQKGTKDCGVFAVAFLTALAYNQDPADGPIEYCQDQLRSHLCHCFIRQKLVPFPVL